MEKPRIKGQSLHNRLIFEFCKGKYARTPAISLSLRILLDVDIDMLDVDISDVFVAGNVLKVKRPLFEVIAKKLISDVDVFRSSVFGLVYGDKLDSAA